jgi:Lon protease-like protein
MMPASSAISELALFPLRTVLFPGGLLSLKVFEARYLDLMGSCLRQSKPFGVIALKRGREVRVDADDDADVTLEDIGTLAELIDIDSSAAGILQVRCRGTHRFTRGATAQRNDGLWLAQATLLPDDEVELPGQQYLGSVRGLANAITTLKAQGAEPFLEPHLFDQAGWVSNRWCEILPISLAAKQKLMELPDPQVRLQLVDEFLRSKRVVT